MSDTLDSSNPTDLTIIGGGPVGLFGAFYAGLRQMSVRIIDSLSALGGQMTALYPEKYIYDVPGFPRILAKDLTLRLTEQAQRYRPAVALNERVQTLTYDPGETCFVLNTDKTCYATRAVLIAAGIGAFKPKMLNLPEASAFSGKGLWYAVEHPQTFRDQNILIVGGGDSAVDWVNAIAPFARSVTLIHRRDQFRAHEDSVAQMRATPARILTFHELKSLHGGERIQRAIVYDNRSKAEHSLDVDHVIVNIGFESSLGPIKDWGLEITGGQIKVDHAMMTTRPGIFAAGDVVTYPGKLKLIATGFAEACTAVNNAKHFVDPKARVFPGHSTELVK